MTDLSDDVPRLRKIIHVDMDAFFASVEQRDDPDLRGKPVAVGGSRERGVVAAASYEARRYGVRSAMASVTARRKCPELIFVKSRFEVYRSISQQIRTIFAAHTPLIEPLSLDEAYLDVTASAEAPGAATAIAARIKQDILAATGLTASAGISYNKFLAKLASDHRKPDGLFVITPRAAPAFVETLPVARFHGVGPATAARMVRLGIRTGADLRARTLPFLQTHFGKSGSYFYAIARAIDERPVRPNRIRKSIGAETTFAADLHAPGDMQAALAPLIDKVWQAGVAHDVQARTVTLKIKYADFRQITRGRSVAEPIASRDHLQALTFDLLAPLLPVERGVRLLGVSLSSLTGDKTGVSQLSLAF